MQLTRQRSIRPADLFGEFDRFFRSGLGLPAHSGNLPREFSLYEAEQSWMLRADFPGYRKEDLGVEVRDGILLLTGTANEERLTSAFQHSLRLPKGVKADGITARLENGVLELVLPKAEPEKPEALRIDIN